MLDVARIDWIEAEHDHVRLSPDFYRQGRGMLRPTVRPALEAPAAYPMTSTLAPCPGTRARRASRVMSGAPIASASAMYAAS